MKRIQELEVRISIPSIKTDEIDKYLFNLLNLFNLFQSLSLKIPKTTSSILILS